MPCHATPRRVCSASSALLADWCCMQFFAAGLFAWRHGLLSWAKGGSWFICTGRTCITARDRRVLLWREAVCLDSQCGAGGRLSSVRSCVRPSVLRLPVYPRAEHCTVQCSEWSHDRREFCARQSGARGPSLRSSVCSTGLESSHWTGVDCHTAGRWRLQVGVSWSTVPGRAKPRRIPFHFHVASSCAGSVVAVVDSRLWRVVLVLCWLMLAA